MLLSLAAFTAAGAETSARSQWWWDEAWWSSGQLESTPTLPVAISTTSYRNGDVEVPVTVLRPRDNKQYPGVLFVHGRRGFDELVQLHAMRVAAQGFIVFAPDLFSGRFIEKMPITHDSALEDDLDKGVEAFLQSPGISSRKLCFYSHTRGGYFTLKVSVKKKRQEKDIACYVSYYPHWQDPNAPEALQVYAYAPEINDFTVPAMIFAGEQEQYQRKRVIETSVEVLRARNRPITYVVYQGVGRGFDFRPDNVRTFADDLAAKDAIVRSARFMRAHLGAKGQ
jgi:carboxymethylenebutenolidase